MKSYKNGLKQVLVLQADLKSTENYQEEIEAPPIETTAMVSVDLVDVPEEEESQEEKRRGWRFFLSAPPSREQLWTIMAFWGVVLLGAVLRFWDLGAKPLHWDESLHGYFSMQLLHSNIENWSACLNLPIDKSGGCYRYNPLLHGPFQFHAIALVYLISRLLGALDHGINTTTVRIAAALLGTVIVGMPYFLRQYLGKLGAWLACFLLAVSPSMVYFSRFAREDIYMACFTLMLIVAVVQYIRTRKVGWAILAVVSFVLSYATKEATFLSIAVFGSFAGALLVWEIASCRLWNLQAPPEASGKVDVVQLQLFPPAEKRTSSFSFLLERFRPRIVVLSALLVYFVVIGIPAVLLLNWTKSVSIYTNVSKENMNAAQAVVDNLKNATLQVVPWLGIVLAIGVFIFLAREGSNEDDPQQRRGLARWVDPQKQRLLDTIVTMPWTHWFFALVIGWTVFLVLFTALFTYMPGIGDAVWQGIFYWITQQTVARGGQPWYYYFMLIPLYEQIGLIFGLVGIVNCLAHPTRFRFFLIYWFVGNFFIYTWAGEKMPWLVIHMTMPLMLLAAIGLRPIVERLIQLGSIMVRDNSVQSEEAAKWGRTLAPKPLLTPIVILGAIIAVIMGGIFVTILSSILTPILGGSFTAFFDGILMAFYNIVLVVILGGILIAILIATRQTKAAGSAGGAILGGILALLALILTLQNMYQVTYAHPADAKSELLIYVQTTPYVNTVMDKVAQLDQKYCGGKHEISIGVTTDAVWPFSWYLRDYKNVNYAYNPPDTLNPPGSPKPANCQNYPVVIAAGSALPTMYAQNAPGQNSWQYNYHEYEMRAQGNQGYMPRPCIATQGHPCELQQYAGVDLGPWLSWGANPPKDATFDLGRAIVRVSQWWWQRIPIGRGVPSRGDQFAPDDPGAMMALFIRKDLAVAP